MSSTESPAGRERVSERYLGHAGAEYFRRIQDVSPALVHGAELNFNYFRPYLRSDDKVLDFGCGNGLLMSMLKPRVQEVAGVEVNASAIAAARGAGFTVFAGLDEIPGDVGFSAIISNHVLEHVRDPASTLERLRDSLEPGGRLLLKLPIDSPLERRERQWEPRDIDHHLHTWTPRNLANTLVEAGFEVVTVRTVVSAWHPRLFRLERLVPKWILYGLFALYKMRWQVFAVAVNPK